MRSKLSTMVAISLAACPLLACGPGEQAAPALSRPVKTFVFGGSGDRDPHRYPGRVHANRAVDVSFQVDGQILDLPVRKGQRVEQGDLIARLDPRDFQNELAAARAIWQEAVATRDRYRIAAKSGAVSQQELDEREAATRVAAADLRIKRKALEDSEIRAEFGGTIATRYVQNFEHVMAQQPIVSLQDVAVLEIRVDIPQADMSADITPDDVGRLSARFDVAPDRAFELSVKEFVTDADPVTQTFPITLAMPNPADVELFPGMTASVAWAPPARAQKGVQLVPATAVVSADGGSSAVWVIDSQSSKISRRKVQVGRVVDRQMIEMLGGLQRGETIAIAGVAHLRDGMKVHPLHRTASAGLPSVAAGPSGHAN